MAASRRIERAPVNQDQLAAFKKNNITKPQEMEHHYATKIQLESTTYQQKVVLVYCIQCTPVNLMTSGHSRDQVMKTKLSNGN